MAMNVADLQARQSRQSRPIQGRDSILPKADTRTPEFRPSGDMRSAQRGDGGAEELMRTLGLANKAAQSFQSYADDKFAKDEDRNAAQGATDEASGHVNPELMAKSAAYKNAVSLGRTSTTFDDDRRDFVKDLGGFIEQQTDEHLEVRLSQVRGKVDEFYKNFAVDPETGKLKEFLSTPGAMRYLSEQMKATRAQVEAAAAARVEQRFKGEALSHASAKLRSQAIDGVPLNFAEARATLPPTISSDEIRAMFLNTVIATATEMEGAGRLEDSRRLANQAAIITGIALPEATPAAPSASVIGTTGTSNAPKAPPRLSFDKLAAAVRTVESGGDPGAVSSKGAVGTMQTMPFTLSDPGFGVQPAKDDSPAERERVGRDYLRAMLKRYNGSYAKALAAYNAGPGKVDEWIARRPKATDAEFVSLIPYGETRAYVGKVLTRAGMKGFTGATDASDPVAANPGFVLEPEELDPVKRADADPRLAFAPQLTGDLELRPEERERLIEFRQTLGNRISERWNREHREAQDEAAGEFLLRLNGLGVPLTSQEINEAARTRRITPQQVQSLNNLLRQNVAEAENAEDRSIARADREEARRRDKETETIASHYLGSIANDRETPQAARARLLTEAPTIRDPEVRRRVIQQVGEFANSVESIRANSAPVRRVMGQVDDLEQRQRERLNSVAANRRQVVAARMASEFDVSRARIARAVANGEDPEKVYAAEQARLGTVWGSLSPRRPSQSK